MWYTPHADGPFNVSCLVLIDWDCKRAGSASWLAKGHAVWAYLWGHRAGGNFLFSNINVLDIFS